MGIPSLMAYIDLNHIVVTEEDLMAADNIPGQPSSDPIALAVKKALPVELPVWVTPAVLIIHWSPTLRMHAKLPQHAVDFIAAYDQGKWEFLEPFEMDLTWELYQPKAGPTVIPNDFLQRVSD